MAYYGNKKILCAYCNGVRYGFEYSAIGLAFSTLELVNNYTLAELSNKALKDFN